MLQIQHREARGGVLLIVRRRVDEDATPGIDAFGKVILDQHVAVRHILHVVIRDARFRDFEGVAHVTVPDECVGAGIQHNRTINEHPIVVISGALRLLGSVGPHAVVAFDHVIWKRVERIRPGSYKSDLHLLRAGGVEVEGDPRVLFNSWILDPR